MLRLCRALEVSLALFEDDEELRAVGVEERHGVDEPLKVSLRLGEPELEPHREAGALEDALWLWDVLVESLALPSADNDKRGVCVEDAHSDAEALKVPTSVVVPELDTLAVEDTLAEARGLCESLKVPLALQLSEEEPAAE